MPFCLFPSHPFLRISPSDTLLWPRRDLLSHLDYGHVDVPRLKAGNVALQMFTIVTGSPKGLNFDSNPFPSLVGDSITSKAAMELWSLGALQSRMERAVFQAQNLADLAAESLGQLELVRTAGDLNRLLAQRATGTAVIGGMLGIEGLHALDGDFANVQRLFNEGVRMMALTHFFDNSLGGSSAGLNKSGITAFGRDVIREMERLGVVSDRIFRKAERFVHFSSMPFMQCDWLLFARRDHHRECGH